MEARLREYRAARRRRELVDGTKRTLGDAAEKLLNIFPTITFDPTMELDQEGNKLIRSDSKDTVTSVDLTSELSEDSINVKEESWRFWLLKWSLYSAIWLTAFVFFVKIEFGAIFLIVSMLVGVCLNTRTKPRKKGEVSAYSVFNKNCESIDGSLKAEQFEREIIYGAGGMR